MKKVMLGLFSVLFLSVIMAAQAAPPTEPVETIEIQASPHTILLSWKSQGALRITIHADINYSAVDTYSVDLGGFSALYTFADNRGNLVAKFAYDDVVTLVNEGNTELTLSGKMDDGTEFEGTDVVRVVD